MTANPVPEGYSSITPYLLVPNVSTLMDSLKDAFGAIEISRGTRSDGSTRRAEVRIDASPVTMGEPTHELGPMSASIYLYVTDCDSTFQKGD